MPHVHYSQPAPPDRAEPDRPPAPAPAIRPSPVCPTCGLSPAVVFPVLRTGEAAEGPLVCLACCPRVPGGRPTDRGKDAGGGAGPAVK